MRWSCAVCVTYKDLGKDTYKDLGKDTYKHTGGALELCYMCHVSHIRTHTSTQEARWSCAFCVTHKDTYKDKYKHTGVVL